MTDREMLEAAAREAGIEVRWHDAWECFVHIGEWYAGRPLMRESQMMWVPLTDDGDALRLALRRGISVWRDGDLLWVDNKSEPVSADIDAQARLAIVRAAALGGAR